MIKVFLALICSAMLGACASVPRRGSDLGSISCRLHRDESGLLTLSIRNSGQGPVELPTWNEGVPRLTVTIQEEPKVMSPPNFGGARHSSRTIPPGDGMAYPLSKDYLLFYGTPTEGGWSRFTPADRTYHVQVTLETKAGPIVSNVFGTRLK